jgi:hypothetical protein
MSVLAEALSVVVPAATLEARYPGGVAGFHHDCHGAGACCDGRLARVGLLSPHDVDFVINLLEAHGLVHLRGGVAQHVVVVDQYEGPVSPCVWIEYGHDAEGIAQCWAADAPRGLLAVPEHWDPQAHESIIPATRNRFGRALRARQPALRPGYGGGARALPAITH